MRWIVGVVVLLAGCLTEDTVTCPALRVCPAGTVCTVLGTCASPQQLDACAGNADGDFCDFSNVQGVCNMGVCVQQDQP